MIQEFHRSNHWITHPSKCSCKEWAGAWNMQVFTESWLGSRCFLHGINILYVSAKCEVRCILWTIGRDREKAYYSICNELNTVIANTELDDSPLLSLEKEGSPSGNRTRIEIIVNMLDAVRDHVLKTHIMYRANLSHRQLQRYLNFLLENGLVEKIQSTNSKSCLYHITSKVWTFREIIPV